MTDWICAKGANRNNAANNKREFDHPDEDGNWDHPAPVAARHHKGAGGNAAGGAGKAQGGAGGLAALFGGGNVSISCFRCAVIRTLD